MSCSNPMKAFKIGLTENGKDRLKICSFNTYYVTDLNGEKVYDYKLIPCGRCVACRLAYARQWSIRCCLEAHYYEHNYFLTLTYNDENNPRTLVKKDWQDFMKLLRSKLEYYGKPSPRFFMCGEYGSENLRPHFHAILFNLELDDLKFLKHSKCGDNLFTSAFVDSCWNKGFIQIGSVNIKSAGYVARYCLKSFNHNDVEKIGLNPEFILMSRRPGIGFSYFDKNKIDIYKTDKIYFNFGDFNVISPPKYYDSLYEKLDPDLLAKIKDLRRFKADLVFTAAYLKSDLVSELDYMRMCNDAKEKKISILRSRKYA